MFECDKVVVLRNARNPAPEVFVHIGEGQTYIEMKLDDFVAQIKKELICPSPFLNRAVSKVIKNQREAAQLAYVK